ncbi:hypothetical protein PG994_014523 [Apiospora phragmitis]|uniref:Secreted protein n=1 Tax=Apiospora phragmitis TaxID=2905665 RepID=A0ABR1T4J1_9PEZI
MRVIVIIGATTTIAPTQSCCCGCGGGGVEEMWGRRSSVKSRAPTQWIPDQHFEPPYMPRHFNFQHT